MQEGFVEDMVPNFFVGMYLDYDTDRANRRLLEV